MKTSELYFYGVSPKISEIFGFKLFAIGDLLTPAYDLTGVRSLFYLLFDLLN